MLVSDVDICLEIFLDVKEVFEKVERMVVEEFGSGKLEVIYGDFWMGK